MAHVATRTITALLVIAATFSSSVLARKPVPHPRTVKGVAFAMKAASQPQAATATPNPAVAPASAPPIDNDGNRFDYASCGCLGT